MHHGSVPLPDDLREKAAEAVESLRRTADAVKLGATGRFPGGRLGPEDEGEIRFAVSIRSGKIVLSFGKQVEWIGFGREEALALSDLLRQRAAEL